MIIADLRKELSKRGLRPALVIGDSPSCWAQWWAYEAIDEEEHGNIIESKKYIELSLQELEKLDKLSCEAKHLDEITWKNGLLKCIELSHGLGIR